MFSTKSHVITQFGRSPSAIAARNIAGSYEPMTRAVAPCLIRHSASQARCRQSRPPPDRSSVTTSARSTDDLTPRPSVCTRPRTTRECTLKGVSVDAAYLQPIDDADQSPPSFSRAISTIRTSGSSPALTLIPTQSARPAGRSHRMASAPIGRKTSPRASRSREARRPSPGRQRPAAPDEYYRDRARRARRPEARYGQAHHSAMTRAGGRRGNSAHRPHRHLPGGRNR